MTLKNFDVHNAPLWLNFVLKEVEQQCWSELKNDSESYQKILAESSDILDEHLFISNIIDGDPITEPMDLSVEEVRALSRFYVLECDRRDLQALEMYLLGCRHALEVMELIKAL